MAVSSPRALLKQGPVCGPSCLRLASSWVLSHVATDRPALPGGLPRRTGGSGLLQGLPWHQQVRTRKRGLEYQPNNIKRKRTHGWIKRISSRGGIEGDSQQLTSQALVGYARDYANASTYRAVRVGLEMIDRDNYPIEKGAVDRHAAQGLERLSENRAVLRPRSVIAVPMTCFVCIRGGRFQTTKPGESSPALGPYQSLMEKRREHLQALEDWGSLPSCNRRPSVYLPTREYPSEQSPHSFTGEDSAELHVHGGPAVISGVLQALGSLPGLRPAEAGEFTRRAFHAGKLDLTEVEGLGDLIHAETEAQRRQALRQMAGELGRLYQTWSQELVRCLAHTEAFIDFSEEEMIDGGVLNEERDCDTSGHWSSSKYAINRQSLTFKDAKAFFLFPVSLRLRVQFLPWASICMEFAYSLRACVVDDCVARLESEIAQHLRDGRRGERLRGGIHVVIAGETNAGKSSLLNTLCQRPVAIVSPVAGTTRDIVETPLDIGGFPILLSDTAGLRDTPDSVEREGVRRARERVEQADLTLAVLDVTALPRDPRSSPSFLTGYLRDVLSAGQDPGSGLGRCLLVLNKTDLLTGEQVDGLRGVLSPRPEGLPPVCLLSCRTGDGLGDFLGVLQEQVETMCGDPLAGAPSLTQARHRSHLQKCCQGLAQYRWYRERDLALAAEGLRLALTSLGRITGRVGAEEILDVIFRDFCIGK
ncbi:GTPB3 GTPase, partial [Atractosteus spatula]|nr:GTPB3 GTPase [Atractosteus spatula]